MSIMRSTSGPLANITSVVASVAVHAGVVSLLVTLSGRTLDAAPPSLTDGDEGVLVTIETFQGGSVTGVDDLPLGETPTDAEPMETLEAETIEPEALDPETDPIAAPETVETIEPETTEAPEPIEIVEPEQNTVEPGAIEPVDDTTTDIETIQPDDPEIVEAAQPEVVEPSIYVDPDDISPVLPDGDVVVGETPDDLETVTPGGGGDDILTPDAPDAEDQIAILIPDEVGPELILPLQPDNGGVVPITVQPDVQTLQPDGDGTGGDGTGSGGATLASQDAALARIIDGVRGTPPVTCVIALPRRDGDTGVGLAMIGSDSSTIEQLSRAVLTGDFGLVPTTRAIVDERQCPALEYIQDTSAYPATPLALSLDTRTVASGEALTGVIEGVAGREVMVMIVDDNGVVQDLERFLVRQGDEVLIDVPLNLAGEAGQSSQIILAMASDTSLADLRARMGREAQDVFLGLPASIASSADLAIETIQVR